MQRAVLPSAHCQGSVCRSEFPAMPKWTK
jgi:hypothetical protein